MIYNAFFFFFCIFVHIIWVTTEERRRTIRKYKYLYVHVAARHVSICVYTFLTFRIIFSEQTIAMWFRIVLLCQLSIVYLTNWKHRTCLRHVRQFEKCIFMRIGRHQLGLNDFHPSDSFVPYLRDTYYIFISIPLMKRLWHLIQFDPLFRAGLTLLNRSDQRFSRSFHSSNYSYKGWL